MSVSQKFPLQKSLVALLVVPPSTFCFVGLIATCLARVKEWPPIADVAWYPLYYIVFAWPGYIVFLVLGLPSLYILFRYKYLSLWVFMLIGALYTSATWIVISLLGPPSLDRFAASLRETFIFVLAGALGGALTRTIVFGWRSKHSKNRSLLLPGV